MSNTAKTMELLKRKGTVLYDTIRAETHVKNVPDVIYKLRCKGHAIESVWEEKNGKKHVVAYRYYSNGDRNE